MKDEYDFTGAVRGKFHRTGASLRLPIYLDDQVFKQLKERADAKGLSVSELVDELLKQSA